MARAGINGGRTVAAVRAPHLPATAGPWFNILAPPIWRDRVTLVDFWTYSCINCLRTLPALRAWHATYAAAGLTILGVHTPEFPFEREPANVARALRELAIEYPVVLDNDRAIWSAFANRVWPHRYLIDNTGRIVHEHAGEGGEVATEHAIRAALGALPDNSPLPTPIFSEPIQGETNIAASLMDDTPGAVCIPGSPELFAGYYRGVSGNAGGFREDVSAEYTDAGGYREGFIHLQGRWRVDADAAHFVGPEPGALHLAFRGTAPNVVLAPDGPAAVSVAVSVSTLDKADNAAGEIAERTQIAVNAPRLYHLSVVAGTGSLGGADLQLLTLVPAAPGLAVYSFTFSDCS